MLEHLLGEHATIPPKRGLFLERTRRMHPNVCAFVSEVVYDGRLESAEGMERQELEGVGAGIRYLPVEHEGRSQLADLIRLGAGLIERGLVVRARPLGKPIEQKLILELVPS